MPTGPDDVPFGYGYELEEVNVTKVLDAVPSGADLVEYAPVLLSDTALELVLYPVPLNDALLELPPGAVPLGVALLELG